MGLEQVHSGAYIFSFTFDLTCQTLKKSDESWIIAKHPLVPRKWDITVTLKLLSGFLSNEFSELL